MRMAWATELEVLEHFYRTTEPVDPFGVYYHPGGCFNCGDGACYMLCPNHPAYLSPEREREDALWQEAMPEGEWMSLAVAQYEREHGEGSYCS